MTLDFQVLQFLDALSYLETMKKQAYLIFLIALLFGGVVVAQPTDTRYGYQYMECVYSTYPDGGKKYKIAIDEYETFLIEEGYLKDGSPESYYGYFLEAQKNGYPEIPPVLFKDVLELVGVESVEGFEKCAFLLEAGEDPIAEKFESAKEKIKSARDISPRFMATVWLETYKPEDFTMDFYKVSFFGNMFPTSFYGSGISRKLPDIKDVPPPPPPPLPENIIDLRINDNDELFINGKQAQIKGLKEKVKDFLVNGAQQEEIEFDGLGKQTKTLGAVYLSNGRGTSYDFYIKVQNQVIAAYAELRDERSQKLFGKSYRELSKEEGKVIKELIPLKLMEF
ncbi:MAG: hypothetical protein SchgKO_11060 [Schleiferiaceae bacterium]